MAEVEWRKCHTEAGGCWGEVMLNRPERKNAITGPFGEQLADALEELQQDQQVQALLLHGAGGAFCSGLDLNAFNAEPEPAWVAGFQASWRRAHNALFNCNKPIVGALERYAINGGAALAIACDYLIAGEQAFLQVGEVQIGMAAPYNMAWLNLRHSERVIAEVTLIGDRLPAVELVRLGLANESVADDQVLLTARALCQRFADFPVGTPQKSTTGRRARVNDSADAWFERHTAVAGPRVKPSSMR